MKRERTIILSLALLVAMLVGCLGVSASAETAENVTITVAWGATESSAYDAWRKTFFDPYTEAHPNVTIDFISQSGIEDTVRVQIAAGAGPDIFMADRFSIADYAKAGRILDLTDDSQKLNWSDMFLGWALDSCKYEGKLYGVPHAADVTGMYYNADMLAKLGLNVPTNRAEYVACCKAALDAGYHAIGFGFSDGALMTQWVIDHYMTCIAGKDGIEKLFTGKYTFKSEEIAEVFKLLKEDWDAGFINDGMSGAITSEEGRALFVNGQALFNPEGLWLSSGTVEPGTWGFKWGFTVWPSMKDGIPSAGGTGLGDLFMINAKTAHPDICVDLLNFMYSDKDRVANGVAMGLEIPCIPLTEEDFAKDVSEDVINSVASFVAVSNDPNVSYCPWSGYPDDTNVWLYENISKLWYGEYSLDQFLDGAQKVLDQDLAEGYTFVAY